MKNLADILLTTLISVFVGTLVSLVMVLLLSTADSAILAAILIPFNIFLPTLLGVSIYHSLKTSKLKLQQYGVFQQGFRLSIVFGAGLLLWAVLEVLIGSGIQAGMLSKMKRTFVSQFLGFVPVAIAIAFAIPIIDKKLNTNKTAAKRDVADRL